MITHPSLKTVLLAGVAGALLLTDAAPALAQAEAQTQQPVLEEIIVTARKRAENLQDTPQAITAFTAADIKAARIQELDDVAKLTTGLNFTSPFGSAVATPIIRGSAQTFGAPNVGVFVDGVYLTGKPAMVIDLNDLERIEVVKGPQSSLYGRNTFAGAINYVTKAPSFEPSGEGEITVGNQGTREFLASISTGLTQTVAVRLGGKFRTSDGYYESVVDGGKVDFEEVWGVSGDMLVNASDRLTLRARVSYAEEDSGQPASEVIDSNGLRRAAASSPFAGRLPAGLAQTYVGKLPSLGKQVQVDTDRSTPGELTDYGLRQETLRTSLTADYEIGGGSITSITAWSKRDNEYQYDGDNRACLRTGGCPTFTFGPPTIPQVIIPQGASTFATSSEVNTTEDFSQELRYASDTANRFRYLLGAFYYDSNTDAVQRSLSPLSPLPAFGYPRSETTTESIAVFGSLAFDITDRLTVTGEARQEWEDQTLSQAPTVTAGVPPTDASLRVINLEEDFSFFTPRVIVDFKATDDLLVYASVAKGTKTGGFNTGLRVLPGQFTYGEEKSWTYEGGAKLTWLDGRAITNIAAYHTDWTDQQVACQNPVTVGGTSTQRTYTCNVGQADINGFEADLSFAVTEALTLQAGYTFTDATYNEFVDDSLAALLVNAGITAPYDFDGRRLPYVPKHALFGSLQADVEISPTMSMFGRFDVNWQSKQYIRADNLAYIGSRTLADLRIGVRSGNFTVTGYVDNLFDDKTPSTAVRFFDSVSYFVSSPLVTGAERRQFGVTVNYSF